MKMFIASFPLQPWHKVYKIFVSTFIAICCMTLRSTALFFLFMVLFRVFFLALRSYHMIFWLCSHWWTSGIIGLNKFVLVARSGRDIVLNDHFLRLFVGVNWFHSSRIYCIALVFKVIQSLV